MPQSNILILGAGLTGLSCAYHLRHPCAVLEASDDVGGAARSYLRQGFTFDCTGHWLHLKDAAMRSWVEQLMPGALVSMARRAAVHSHGVTTPYPFQAHTYGLPPEVVAECVLGFFAARAVVQPPPPRSFEDYILQCMGAGIAKHFMIPYNTKLWTVPPADMAHAWCGRFVPVPTAEEVVYGALRPQGAGHALGYNAHFLYPREGGIGALAHALHRAVKAPVQLNSPAVRVDWQGRRVQLPDGSLRPYSVLVSTVPLVVLIQNLMQSVPERVADAARLLRATTVTYWNVGVARPNTPTDPHWIYYPDPAIPFYRAGSASAVLPSMAPPGQASFYVEASHPRGTPCPVSDAAVAASMRTVGLLKPEEEPVFWERCSVDCGYTIMDHAYGPARQAILDWLTTVGIVPAGRYGAWMYDSMEGSLQQGQAAAERATGLLKSI